MLMEHLLIHSVRIYASIHQAIIGSNNGLSPDWHHTIIWTNADILLIWTHGNKCQWNFIQNEGIFIQENAFEEMTATKLVFNALTWHPMVKWLAEYDRVPVDRQVSYYDLNLWYDRVPVQ